MAHVVASSGWLEYFADSDRAGLFAPAIEDTENLVVPVISGKMSLPRYPRYKDTCVEWLGPVPESRAKGPAQASPGQRPGIQRPRRPALKGRNNPALSRPCRAADVFSCVTQGVALGWLVFAPLVRSPIGGLTK